MNEDSFLADGVRGIFCGLRTAWAAPMRGEVASQKAVDVLNDAFREKVTDG